MRWRRGKREEDLDRELRADLELEAAEQRESGLSPEEAHYAAMRALGNQALLREHVRETWGWSWIESTVQDLRYAARVLRRSPGFTAIAVLSLAIGIGANTSVFSIVDAVLLKSLPIRHPEQLRIFTWNRYGYGAHDPAGMTSHSGYCMGDDYGGCWDGSFSYPAYETFRRALPQFSDLVAYGENQVTVTAAGTADFAFGQYVSGNYFTGLGAQALLGRAILPDDDQPSSPHVAVLTHLYWTRRFGGDPAVVGRLIQVNREPVTVVGVMPPAFQGLLPGREVDLFLPMSAVPATGPKYYSIAAPDIWWVQIFGRLKPGVPDQAAAAAIQAVLAHHIESYTGAAIPASSPIRIALAPGGRGVSILRDSKQTAILILAVTAVLVLLIACLNLANLLLARYAARAKEIAVRVSIGAGRRRVARQMFTESLLLAGLGALAGLLLARPMNRLFLDFLAGTVPLGLDAHLDTRALAFALCAALLTALLFGTIPAWRAARLGTSTVLKEAAAIAGGGPRLTIGRYLVSLQIALSLILVVGTGLFLRTLQNLAAVDLGFATDHILTFQTDPGRSGYQHAEALPLYHRLQERITAIPGVESLAMSQLPLIGGVVTNGGVRLPGEARRKPTWFLFCSDSFLSNVRIPLLLGRDLSAQDFDHPGRSAVVNEAFVRRYLPGINPIGRIFYPPDWGRDGDSPQPMTIVGVARDAHYQGVRAAVPPTAYMPFALRPPGDSNMVFMVRTRLAPMSIVSAVRQAIAGVDPNLPVAQVRTEQDQVNRSLGTERMFGTLVTTFGVMALVLAAIGLYGVMAFSVARRTSEVGIRMALGARRGDVQWLVLRQSLYLAALGVLAGIPCALALTGLVKKLLYGVKPNDLASLIGAIVLMLLVAAGAAWIPARRASHVDPMVALRYE